MTLKANEWSARRRYDGFLVLAAHPELTHSAAELARLYRAKDAVEKDFGIIKSLIKLRPVRHRTDAKVRAHVTLCMLALLLERTLRRKLGTAYTAAAALELLATCHLNQYRPHEPASPPAYLVTHTNPDQDRILRILRLQHLADDAELADLLTPR